MVRGWSALVEEMLLDWLERPDDISRETLLDLMANALTGLCSGCQADKITSSPWPTPPSSPSSTSAPTWSPSVSARTPALRPPDQAGAGALQGSLGAAGGFVDENEDAAKAARRELKEETGLVVGRRPFRHLGAYSAPKRDPRHRVVSMSYWTTASPAGGGPAADDAADVRWWPVTEALGPSGSPSTTRRSSPTPTTLCGRAIETTTLAALAARGGVHDRRAAQRRTRRCGDAPWTRATSSARSCRTPGFVADSGWRTSGRAARHGTPR